MFQAFGLTGPGSPNKTALTAEFNGAGWSTGGTANTARYDVAGTGLQTAGLASGGIDGSSNQTLVEEYNGTSWSEVNDIPAAVKQSNMFGIQTAAVQAGGNGSPSYLDTCILLFDLVFFVFVSIDDFALSASSFILLSYFCSSSRLDHLHCSLCES